MIHAFIIRPFGTKNGIDFDRVERELVQPALEKAGCDGGTMGEFIVQGNIRTDMFEELLIADLVIADISIHNANVFYELGIRHGFRDRTTFLIKCKGDDVPFDLKTDRYLAYDGSNPAASIDALAAALKATIDQAEKDSPVFQLLPELEPVDRNKYLRLPLDFHEAVEHAEAAKNCADLQLLAAELDGFSWREAGLRLIGRAQFRLRDWRGAKATWIAVRDYSELDREANTLLGTIFQRLGDLVSSNQALERALQNKNIGAHDRAEARALMGRNAKNQWEKEWATPQELDAIQKIALRSAHLERSIEFYRQGFVEDRNHFYSGLNALAMLTIQTELALAQRLIWEENFDSKEDAQRKLDEILTTRVDIAAGVKLALESYAVALKRRDQTDPWVEIGAADLAGLTSTRAHRIAQAYKKALAGATDQARESVRRQFRMCQRLGILKEVVVAVLADLPEPESVAKSTESAPRILLFTGHRIDAAGRTVPRFPPAKEQQAREMIRAAVKKEVERNGGKLLGISGGASGGDILFHEVCEELGIPSEMHLAFAKNDYAKASVADGGGDWMVRFNRLCERLKPKIFSESVELPRWLRTKKGYEIWQRSNLWMLHSALHRSQDNLTLIALWNGASGDGPGGTEDMVKRAQDRGARFVHLDARKLLE